MRADQPRRRLDEHPQECPSHAAESSHAGSAGAFEEHGRVSAALTRLGLARLRYLNPPPPALCHEWAQPGKLLRLDAKKLGRIVHPSHRVTGDRRDSVEGAGWKYAHVAIDDCSRFTCIEVLPDEKCCTATGFLVRVLREFRRRRVPVQRMPTDNGDACCSRPFRKVCRWLGMATKRTRPYRPQGYGKAERVIQSLLRKWAYVRPDAHSAQRRAALGPWLRFYSEERPHASLNRRTPSSRLAQLAEQRSQRSQLAEDLMMNFHP